MYMYTCDIYMHSYVSIYVCTHMCIYMYMYTQCTHNILAHISLPPDSPQTAASSHLDQHLLQTPRTSCFLHRYARTLTFPESESSTPLPNPPLHPPAPPLSPPPPSVYLEQRLAMEQAGNHPELRAKVMMALSQVHMIMHVCVSLCVCVSVCVFARVLLPR